MLKSLYFPTGDFINAKKGHRASWCWSSILVGRDLLKDDLIWDIDNGAFVRIWDDHWVPDIKFPSKPSGRNDDIMEKGKVADLIANGQ